MRPHPLLLAILAALPACGETFESRGCLAVAEDVNMCPAPDKVSIHDLFLADKCGTDLEITEVKGAGTLDESVGQVGIRACCYPVEGIDHEPGEECIIGRPYVENDGCRSVTAALATSGAASTADDRRAERAYAWLKAGEGEHASVAAFNRLSLQLLALGAPLELLSAVQSAALDEANHARLCWNLAQSLADAPVTHGAFPFHAVVDPQTSLADLAYAAVREGCLAETLGACVADSIAKQSPDADAGRVLAQLAGDELGHAVLSFRIVSWAMQAGGSDVRAAVQRALDEAWPRLDTRELALRSGVDRESIEIAAQDALSRVLRPAARALMA